MARAKKSGDSYNNPFPTNLRALMNRQPATTQDKLAEITGKTRQTVSQYVNGVSEPGFDTLVRIASYFNCSTDYLLGRTNDPAIKPSLVDELGFLPEAIQVFEEIKSCGDIAVDGMNLFVSQDGFAPITTYIGDLKQMIEEEIEAGVAYPVPDECGDRSGAFQREIDEGLAGYQLETSIKKMFPEIKDRFKVVPKSKIIDAGIIDLVDYFRRYAYTITGYNQYVEEREKRGISSMKPFDR